MNIISSASRRVGTKHAFAARACSAITQKTINRGPHVARLRKALPSDAGQVWCCMRPIDHQIEMIAAMGDQ